MQAPKTHVRAEKSAASTAHTAVSTSSSYIHADRTASVRTNASFQTMHSGASVRVHVDAGDVEELLTTHLRMISGLMYHVSRIRWIRGLWASARKAMLFDVCLISCGS